MVLSRQSVRLTTHFSWASSAKQELIHTLCTYFHLNQRKEQNDREHNLQESIGLGQDQTHAPGFAVRLATDCDMGPVLTLKIDIEAPIASPMTQVRLFYDFIVAKWLLPRIFLGLI